MRPAFTLIEVIIVMLIITILMGILLPAVNIARRMAWRTQAVSDMANLSLMVAHAKNVNECRYLPAYITIKSSYDLTNAQDAYDFGQLQQFYGNRFGTKNTMTPTTMMSGLPDWGLIQGSQCLVFFLGGWNGTSFTTGVQASNNPFTPGGTRSTLFDFQPSRLWLPPGSQVPCFVDPFPVANAGGTPYAYMTSCNGNDYGFNTYNPTGQCVVTAGVYTNYANSALTMTVNGGTIAPFTDVTGKFVNPGAWQIISAGADGTFGPGGAWKPGQFPYVAQGLPGSDDLSIFWNGALGISQ